MLLSGRLASSPTGPTRWHIFPLCLDLDPAAFREELSPPPFTGPEAFEPGLGTKALTEIPCSWGWEWTLRWRKSIITIWFVQGDQPLGEGARFPQSLESPCIFPK